MIDLKEFSELIAAYGGQADNWPSEQRAAMQKLADNDPAAASLVAQESALDAVLGTDMPPLHNQLQERILRDLDNRLNATNLVDFSQTSKSGQKPGQKSGPIFGETSGQNLTWSAAAMAACFVGGFFAAPELLDAVLGGADLMASLDIISDAFLPIEPL